MSQFKTVTGRKLGYAPIEVDALIALARQQFEQPDQRLIDAVQLRSAQFTLEKGGYQPALVDAALDRLDDAFVQREVLRLKHDGANTAALDYLDSVRAKLMVRSARPNRHRFSRVGLLQSGYSVRQVDNLLNQIASPDAAQTIAVAQLRDAAFKPARRGYNEAQVDAFIDRAIEFIQLSVTLR